MIKRKNMYWAFIMIFPLIFGITIFNVIPFFQNLYFSFTDIETLGDYEYIGIENYIDILTDEDSLAAFVNTFWYVIVTVPCTLIISLLIANLLNSKIKGRGIYRSLLFIPAVTTPTSIGMIWKWLYNNDYGLLNEIVEYFGFQKQSWLGDENLILISVMIMIIWAGLAYKIVIFLAGLQTIPNDYYEAAKLDGANDRQCFFKITLPLLTPTTFFLLVMSVIDTMQMFDAVYLLIGKGNLVESYAIPIVSLFFKHAFTMHEQGYGAAITIIIFAITLLITLIQLALQKYWVHY